jgi:hypothetical protein
MNHNIPDHDGGHSNVQNTTDTIEVDHISNWKQTCLLHITLGCLYRWS